MTPEFLHLDLTRWQDQVTLSSLIYEGKRYWEYLVPYIDIYYESVLAIENPK